MNDIGKSKNNISIYSDRLFTSIAQLISNAQKKGTISLNAKTTLLYWSIGNFINIDLKTSGQIAYCSKINATLSQQLSWNHPIVMPDNNRIRVAQYLTELPSKAWFADKLHRALQIAKQNT